MQMILNSQKIYTRQTGKQISFLGFTLKVDKALIVDTEPIVSEKHQPNENAACLIGRHFLTTKKPSSEDAKNKHSTKACKVCKVCYASGLLLRYLSLSSAK